MTLRCLRRRFALFVGVGLGLCCQSISCNSATGRCKAESMLHRASGVCVSLCIRDLACVSVFGEQLKPGSKLAQVTLARTGCVNGSSLTALEIVRLRGGDALSCVHQLRR